jgi:hypothetical protein
MARHLGDWLYWTATVIAAAIVLWDVVQFLHGLSQGEPIIPIAALSFAAVIWLVGRGCRQVLARH